MYCFVGDNLVVFCYLSASEICPDKRGGLSRGEQFSSILLSVHLKSDLIRGVVSLEGRITPLIRSDFRCTEIAKYY
jgi:hypothetical protein